MSPALLDPHRNPSPAGVLRIWAPVTGRFVGTARLSFERVQMASAPTGEMPGSRGVIRRHLNAFKWRWLLSNEGRSGMTPSQ